MYTFSQLALATHVGKWNLHDQLAHFLVAINIRNGKTAWKKRVTKANLLHIDGRVIILDEDGNLSLTTPSPEGLEVHAKCDLLDHVSWTAPTLVGRTLYVRDRATITAVDLGA